MLFPPPAEPKLVKPAFREKESYLVLVGTLKFLFSPLLPLKLFFCRTIWLFSRRQNQRQVSSVHTLTRFKENKQHIKWTTNILKYLTFDDLQVMTRTSFKQFLKMIYAEKCALIYPCNPRESFMSQTYKYFEHMGPLFTATTQRRECKKN